MTNRTADSTQVGPLPADWWGMTRSDVALTQEQHRGLRAAQHGKGAVRDCGVCGSEMDSPRDQTLVVRDVARVVRRLYLCGTCRSWESLAVPAAS